MDYVTACDPADLPVGAYLFDAVITTESDGEKYSYREMYRIEADTNTQAAERAAEWCANHTDRAFGAVYLITGDDSSGQIAHVTDSGWIWCR